MSGLYLDGIDDGDEELGGEFIRSPVEFAKNHGLDPEDLMCPPEAHEAFARGQAFADRVGQLGVERVDEASVQEIVALAESHLGPDLDVALIPFGLRFREKASPIGSGGTATGSGTVTFLDGDADSDS